MTTSHLRCIDGPHKGEWRDVDWTYDCVLLVRDAGPKGVEKDSHLPTLEYMHQMVQGMIENMLIRFQHTNAEAY